MEKRQGEKGGKIERIKKYSFAISTLITFYIQFNDLIVGDRLFKPIF